MNRNTPNVQTRSDRPEDSRGLTREERGDRDAQTRAPRLRWFGLSRYVFFSFALLLGSGQLASAELTPDELELELLSFDEARGVIEARYPNVERLDDAWQARADSLRQELESATSFDQSAGILRSLAHSFGESHFEIIPRESYQEIYEYDDDRADTDDSDGAEGGAAEDSEDGADGSDRSEDSDGSDDSEDSDESDEESEDEPDTPPEGNVGIDVRWIDESLVVTGVAGESSAQAAGVLAGDQILAIDGKTIDEIADLLRGNQSSSVSRFETNIAIVGQGRLSGHLGDTRDVQLCRQLGDTLEVSLEIEPWRGVPTKLGALPERTVETFAQDYGDVGLFGFSLFLAPGTVMPFVQSSFETFGDRDGIIIDLRGNFGGLMPMIQGVVGWLVEGPTQLGHMKMRGGDLKLFANPRAPRFEGKVAVLTDELSISAAELFSAGVQEAGLARVFGGRTAGLALPANVMKLPNGDGFMFVVADYTTPEGQRLERTGVIPDEEISFSRFDLYERDPVLDAALAWIRN